MMKKLALILPFFILIFSVVTINAQQQQTVNEVKIWPPDAKPFGLSYEEHVKNYWKWQVSLPIEKIPLKTVQEKSVSMVKLIQIHQYFILVVAEEAPMKDNAKSLLERVSLFQF
jgi:hypothetical protein